MFETLVNGIASVWTRLFGSRNDRLIDAMLPAVEKICALEPEIGRLSDLELRAKTTEFRERIAKRQKELGVPELFAEVDRLFEAREKEIAAERKKKADRLEQQILDEILPEAFAVCREAGKRVLGMRHFDVQLVGGIVQHNNNISEMVTGEGKTLVSTLAAYLNALLGKGVHIVTVNEYLAERDRDWMAPIHEFLGLTVGVIKREMGPAAKREAYRCDITYGTNSEFGFDYLRDNMKVVLEAQAMRGQHFAIVDEVDSILIDEARTPLIISGPAEMSTDKYYTANRVAKGLQGVERNRLEQRSMDEDVDKEWLAEEDYDYVYSEKDHHILLTDRGIEKAEKLVGVGSFYDEANMDWPHQIDQALRAWNLYKRDKEYVVKEGEVVIVDTFTGRLQPGRHWSDGLHQAIEAKEGLRIKEENQTLATITYQNFYRLYTKLAGMTGTALTEAGEFISIYRLDVISIPTNKPLLRRNHSDVVYRTLREKDKAICDELEAVHAAGRPILVGTISIEKSEQLGGMLERRGVAHNVLNAKQHQREALIVAEAGEMGHCTIATNMAGRGTDIRLGRFSKEALFAHWKKNGAAPRDMELKDPDDPAMWDALETHWKESGLLEEWSWRGVAIDFEAGGKMRKGFPLSDNVKDLGGLHIIGTERHEARRIDNQLRGRCGRQGDPGSSRFYLSLEDDLMRIFASDWVRSILDRLGMEEGQEISHRMVTNAIEKAQTKIEAHHFDARKNVLEYDQVMDEQRKLVYGNRQMVLEGKNTRPMVVGMIEDVVENGVNLHLNEKLTAEDRSIELFSDYMKKRFLMDLDTSGINIHESSGAREIALGAVMKAFEEREEELTPDEMRRLERYLLLSKIDEKWKDHLRGMDQLRSGVGFRGYAQQDPKLAYKKEGKELLEEMVTRVEEEVTHLLFRVRLVTEEEAKRELESTWKGAKEARPADAESAAPAKPAPAPARAPAAKPARAPGPTAAKPDKATVAKMMGKLEDKLKEKQAKEEAQSSAGAAQSKGPKQPEKRKQPKVGRNAKCPCGSGKKYKKCCEAKDAAA